MDAASPTSSITEHSAPGVVNVLKIAQDWQQKQKEKGQQQQQEEQEGATEQKSFVADNNIAGENNRTSHKGSTDGLPLILKPQALHQRNILSDAETKELFVEMCFYARLGFVQPPCCLLCTYQETMEQNNTRNSSNKKMCPRWVIWRQNAETALHPNKLDGNLIITKCHVAQSLLQGNTVEGYAWDSQRKVVTCTKD